jgi:hypothetical protein
MANCSGLPMFVLAKLKIEMLIPHEKMDTEYTDSKDCVDKKILPAQASPPATFFIRVLSAIRVFRVQI